MWYPSALSTRIPRIRRVSDSDSCSSGPVLYGLRWLQWLSVFSSTFTETDARNGIRIGKYHRPVEHQSATEVCKMGESIAFVNKMADCFSLPSFSIFFLIQSRAGTRDLWRVCSALRSISSLQKSLLRWSVIQVSLARARKNLSGIPCEKRSCRNPEKLYRLAARRIGAKPPDSAGL